MVSVIRFLFFNLISYLKKNVFSKGFQSDSIWIPGSFISFLSFFFYLPSTKFGAIILPDFTNKESLALWKGLCVALIISLGCSTVWAVLTFDFKKLSWTESPGVVVNTAGNCFMLAFSLFIQFFQEDNQASIIVNLCLGLFIFFIILKIRPATDFGLFGSFIIRTVLTCFSVYGGKDFLSWACFVFGLALLGVKSWLEVEAKNKIKISRPRFFMDIAVEGFAEARMVIELYEDLAPVTVQNFKVFCKTTKITKIRKDYRIIASQDKAAGESDIVNVLYHPGENTRLQHDQRGLLSTSKESSLFDFFITLSSNMDYNDENMVFGKIIKGIGFLKELENIDIGIELVPTKSIEICGCGEILDNEDDSVNNLFGEKDSFPDWPEDVVNKAEFLWWLGAVGSLKLFGLAAFKMGSFDKALRKFRKAKRYLDVCIKGEFTSKKVHYSILMELNSELSTAVAEVRRETEEIGHGNCPKYAFLSC